MNKKYLIFIGLGLIALLAGLVFINYLNSLKKVTFDIKREGVGIDIYVRDAEDKGLSNDTKVGSLDKSGTITLREEDYYAIPRGDNLNTTAISFTVKDTDSTVAIDPAFSDEYLRSLLPGEYAAIVQVIRSKYPDTIKDFEISQGKLYLDGTWYATTLKQKVHPMDVGDTYRLVLQKQNNSWIIVAEPEIVLTSWDHEAVPERILRDINQAIADE